VKTPDFNGSSASGRSSLTFSSLFSHSLLAPVRAFMPTAPVLLPARGSARRCVPFASAVAGSTAA